MTVHYHGTPITPRSVLQSLAGNCFCVSYARPDDVKECHRIGQGVMLDNGAYSFWRANGAASADDWDACYAWVSPWLEFHTTWAVIPDVIGGTESENDHLLSKWFVRMGSYRQAAPVWHLDESMDRLQRLVNGFSRVCFGSSGEYSTIGSTNWNNRMNEAFNVICAGSGRPPTPIHMLRGMSLAGSIYPFASLDSTDVAQSHHRPQNTAKGLADGWNGIQCPSSWKEMPIQQEFPKEKP